MIDFDIVELLPAQLKHEIIEDVSRLGDEQSVIARKQQRTIEILKSHTRQGERTDLPDKATCASNGVQVGAPSRRPNTTEKVAQVCGESERAVRERVKVLEAAESNAEKWGRFLTEMDADGYPHRAYKRLLGAQRAERIGDDDTPEPGDPIVRRGEVWILGDHRLMCGDSTVPDDVHRLLAGATPHLMVTDAPYGVNFAPAWRAEVLGPRRIPRGVMNDDRADWSEAYALFPGDVAYVYHGSLKSDDVIAGLESLGFERRGHIIWVKPQFVIGRGHYHSQYEGCWYVGRPGRDLHWHGGRDKSDVWMIARSNDGRDDRTNHGTQKPVECMLCPIVNSSQPGDAIYDPFVGSGTTIIAAEIAGRRCFAMDLDPVYCTVAIERWQNFTGRQAVLEATEQTFGEAKSDRLGANELQSESKSRSKVDGSTADTDGGEGLAAE
jgi:DNA modification methylase